MTDAAYVLHQQAVELINRQTNHLAQRLQQLANEVQAISTRLQSTPQLDAIDRAFQAHKELEEKIRRIYILVQTELETAHKEYQRFIQISNTLSSDVTEAKQATAELEAVVDEYNALEPPPSELIDKIEDYDISKKGTFLPKAIDDTGAIIESPSKADINITPKSDDNTKRTLVFGTTKIHNDGTADELQITELTTSSIQAIDDTITLGDASTTITIPGIVDMKNVIIDKIELGDDVVFDKNVTFNSTPTFNAGATFSGSVSAEQATISALTTSALSLPHNTTGTETSEIKRVLTSADYEANPSAFVDSTGSMIDIDSSDDYIVTYGFLKRILDNYSGGSINSIISAIYKLDKSINACLTKESTATFEDIPSSISDWIEIDEAIKTCARNMKLLMTSDDVDLTSALDRIASESASYTDKQSATAGIISLNTLGRKHMIASLASNQSSIFTSSFE